MKKKNSKVEVEHYTTGYRKCYNMAAINRALGVKYVEDVEQPVVVKTMLTPEETGLARMRAIFLLKQKDLYL